MVSASPAMGQATSSVRGTIADQQGSVIPNATITLFNKETNFLRQQQTTPAGNFSFDLVPPGQYKLTVEANGFKKTETAVEALIARPTDLGTLKLAVGSTGETVTVTAESQSVTVNTQDSSLGANFISTQITQLPLEARNPLALLTLQAAVTKDGYVAGARSDQSNITLDGIDINDAQTNSITGPVLRLNAEAIEEFRVNTVSSNAAGGRSAGAQVNLVTKSGSNQFHGALFEFHRNTIFTANTWFNNYDGIKRPFLLRNTFGGALGGPIKKDKLFFFYSYEGRRDASQIAAPANDVPLPTLGQGIIRFKASNGTVQQLTGADLLAIFPDTGGINPAAQKALADAAAKYPANDYTYGDSLPGQLYNVASIRFNAPAPVKLNSHVARLDYNISSMQQLFVRANVIHDHDMSGTANAPALPDSKHPGMWSHPWGIAAAHTWTVRNNLVNNFRYGLTRETQTQSGDTTGNYINFRYVFYPVNAIYDSSRKTPVHNFVDDLSWVKGNHTFQFGVSATLVNNIRDRFGSAFDNATTNPSYYPSNVISGAVLSYLQATRGYGVDPSFNTKNIDYAVTALLGRYTQYTAAFTYSADGKLMPVGTSSHREYATQGYEGYVQDTWKFRPNLTLTGGLRYSLWRPVYERNGFEVQPNIPFTTYWERRVAAMNAGSAYLDPIIIDKSGPANGGAPMYSWDKKVFLPKVAVSYSPRFDSGIMSKLFGKNGQSVIRGGFSIANDYFGQQIATFFDQQNQLGFNSKYTTPASTFNVGCGPWVVAGNPTKYASGCTPALGPLFTGFNQDIRSLPNIVIQNTLTFPQQKPVVARPALIEGSLDSQLTTPRNYVWSATFERELPHGSLIQVSYLRRMARHLLAQRDIATPANLVDAKTGMDWYTAATILEKARQQNTNPSYFATNPLPYFENLFAKLATKWGYTNATQAVYDDACGWSGSRGRCYNGWANDWTDVMWDMEPYSSVGPHPFFQPQYGALDSWSTIGNSNYHALTFSFRQRTKSLTVDFNYTYSHSLDDASGLQNSANFAGAALIENPLRQRDSYASSDFDMRHMINVNSVVQLPMGRGKWLAGGAGGVLNAIIGDWQLSNIFRWNTGVPSWTPGDSGTWSTNFQLGSNTTLINYVNPSGCPSNGSDGKPPSWFGKCDVNAIYQSFRNSYPGETGQRNYFRYPSYINVDMGLGKTWKMPYREGHELQFRWETFNVTNTQPFTGRAAWTVDPTQVGPKAKIPDPNFGNYTGTQGTPRVMQLSLRYAF